MFLKKYIEKNKFKNLTLKKHQIVLSFISKKEEAPNRCRFGELPIDPKLRFNGLLN